MVARYQRLSCPYCGVTRAIVHYNMVKEIRVYVINCGKTDFDFRKKYDRGEHEEIMIEAEKLGSVYSLDYFEEEINSENLDLSNSFILIQ